VSIPTPTSKLSTTNESTELCSMLSLKYAIETQLQSPTTANPQPTFAVWMTFQDDPFLARAGPIGKITEFRGTRTNAQEACCKNATEYVMGLVREDYATEQYELGQRALVQGYQETKIEVLKNTGQWDGPS
jgi:hypothetical protein